MRTAGWGDVLLLALAGASALPARAQQLREVGLRGAFTHRSEVIHSVVERHETGNWGMGIAQASLAPDLPAIAIVTGVSPEFFPVPPAVEPREMDVVISMNGECLTNMDTDGVGAALQRLGTLHSRADLVAVRMIGGAPHSMHRDPIGDVATLEGTGTLHCAREMIETLVEPLLLREPQANERQLMELYSTFAHILEASGDYDGAWAAATRGNKLAFDDARHPRHESPDEPYVSDVVRAVETFESEWTMEALWSYATGNMSTSSGWHITDTWWPGNASAPNTIFVTGLPRSGSTLVEAVLEAHPDARSVGEYLSLPQQAARRETLEALIEQQGRRSNIYLYTDAEGRTSVLDSSKTIRRNIMNELAADYVLRLMAYVDKVYNASAPRSAAIVPEVLPPLQAMPEQEYTHLVNKQLDNWVDAGMLQRYIPDAKIIVMLRDPRALALSNYFLRYGFAAQASYQWSYRLEDIASTINAFYRGIKHWKTVGVDFIFVRYEDLVADPEAQIRRIADAVGMDWDDALLRFHQTGTRFRTASKSQVKEGIHGRRARRWTRYEAQLRGFLEMLDPDVMELYRTAFAGVEDRVPKAYREGSLLPQDDEAEAGGEGAAAVAEEGADAEEGEAAGGGGGDGGARSGETARTAEATTIEV